MRIVPTPWSGPDDQVRITSDWPIKSCRRLPLFKWAVLLALGDVLGSVVLSGLTLGISSVPIQQLWAGAGAFVLLWGLAAHSQQLYRRATLLGGLRIQLLKNAISIALTFGLILLAASGLQLLSGYSRTRLIVWGVGALAWVWMLRMIWHGYVRAQLERGQCLDRAIMLVGSHNTAPILSAAVERETTGEVRIVAMAPIPSTLGGPSPDWVEDAVRVGLVDRVFIAAFENAIAETNALLTRLARLAVDVTLIPNLEGIEAQALRVDRIGMRPTVDVNLVPFTATQAMAKRALDFVLVSIALLVALPVFGLVSLAIKLDSPGPIFFRQWRAGFHDHRFRLWKFRTMYHDQRDEHAVHQTSRADARVTRVGRFLRRTSLDELPQLFNVLKGDMSLVGPRPHALGMTAMGRPLQQVMVNYSARHRVKPGITGWAQVCGCRGEVNSQEKLRDRVTLDCYYIENWSLSFDLWIILRTFVALLCDKNAY